jgi:protoporphyrin/coproporphyrin ferrochelatase
MTRLAVVLFNLGGPDRPEAVRPFVFNLFNDPAIIAVPQPIRWLLARLISRRRAPLATEIYRQLGGGSPLLPNTEAQARALEQALGDIGNVKVFVAMRYWHPLSDATAVAVHAFAPDEVVLLPLYPQFSTTTTASSLGEWARSARRVGLTAKTRSVCCYPADSGFIEAITALVRPAYERALAAGRPRLLFTAHGLPQRVIDRGDPYQAQIEKTASAIVERLAIADLDSQISYQSRVGPLEWLKPYTENELRRAGADSVPLIVVPIAFVSEHSETLVELDITYRDEALKHGVPYYERVATVGVDPTFIAGLARLVREARSRTMSMMPAGGARNCPAAASRCALAGA